MNTYLVLTRSLHKSILRGVHFCTQLFLLFYLLAYSAQAWSIDTIDWADLPPQARQTVLLIQSGGPFPFKKDGTRFNNRERLLPLQPPGYYAEYTVVTPGINSRGARRIVTGTPLSGSADPKQQRCTESSGGASEKQLKQDPSTTSVATSCHHTPKQRGLPEVYYYTDTHYRHFYRITLP